MKILKHSLLIILLSLSFISVAALPPDMQVDQYSLGAEKAIEGENKDYNKAAELMDEIMALKDQHNLELPVEFYFKYAQIWLQSGLNNKSSKAINALEQYLSTTGKTGNHYLEALELYSEALNVQLGRAKTVAEAKQLIAAGADVNATDEDGDTSISVAALLPDMQADRYLLGAEKAIEGENKDYNKAAKLMDKIMALKDQRNLELPVEFYFKYAQIWLQSGLDNKGRKALNALDQYLSTTGKTDNHYFEALELYSEALNVQLRRVKTVAEVKQLIAAGADVNATNEYGTTPLHFAAWSNETPEIINALVAAGAYVNATNESGRTPLHDAETPEIINALVAAGADVNATSENGGTPLHVAVRTKNLEIINALVAAGANVNATTEYGTTPLHLTVQYDQNSEITNVLIAAGAYVKEKRGYTLLRIAAAYNKNPEIINALVAAGADVNATGKYGETPLHSAAKYAKSPEIINALVAAGADVNAATTPARITPLHDAALFNGNLEIINALVAAGADVNATNDFDWTPLKRAASNRNPEIIKALRAAGAKR